MDTFRALFLIYIVFLSFVKNVSSENLDLLDPEFSGFYFEDLTKNGVNYRKFSSNPNKQITSVSSGSQKFWEKIIDEFCRSVTLVTFQNTKKTLVSIDLRKNDALYAKYYTKQNGFYTSLSEAEYHLRLSKFANLSKLAENSIKMFKIFSSSAIDIAKPEESKLISYEFEINDGIPQLTVKVKNGESVNRVEENGNLVWDGSNGSNLVFLNAFSFYGEYRLVELLFEQNGETFFKHYKKDGDDWRDIKIGDFESNYDQIKSQIPVIAKITLDLSKLENIDQFFVKPKTIDNLEYSLYFPLTGYHLHKVSDGKVEIWKSENQRCLSVLVGKKENIISLVKLEVFDNKKSRYLLFNKVGNNYVQAGQDYTYELDNSDVEYDSESDFEVIENESNILQIDENSCFIESKYHGITYRTYESQEGKVYNIIKYKDNVIWEGLPGEYTDFVRVFFPENEPKLGLFRIIYNDSKSEDLYFTLDEDGNYFIADPSYFMETFNSFTQ